MASGAARRSGGEVAGHVGVRRWVAAGLSDRHTDPRGRELVPPRLDHSAEHRHRAPHRVRHPAITSPNVPLSEIRAIGMPTTA